MATLNQTADQAADEGANETANEAANEAANKAACEAACEAACAALCLAYTQHADAGDADALAALFIPEGVFDRMGQRFEGHAAIRGLIAGRPPGAWTQHQCSHLRVELAPDGQHATGQVDLAMARGMAGVQAVERLHAVYTDHYVLTAAGWRFSQRSVVVLA